MIFPEKTIDLSFSYPCRYPVVFTRDVFDIANPAILNATAFKGAPGPKKSAVFVDKGLVDACPAVLEKINDWFGHHRTHFNLATPPMVLPGGEQVKNSQDHLHGVTQTLNDLELDRHGMVFCIGGGALLDMVGFAAAVFHRGIGLTRLPSTTLAQNDAGIGVKNGINAFGRKNCLGTFSVPAAVINDYSFLETLPFEHFIGGVAEAFKIALIRDGDFFNFLEKKCRALRQRDRSAVENLILRCAQLHLNHIAGSGDPFETGRSRPLDFGHWSAHKIEMLSGFSMGHGQAVSIGVALDSIYAWHLSLISEIQLDRIIGSLQSCGLPIWSPYLEIRDLSGHLEIENGLEEFRQHLGGCLTFTMINGIGTACELHEMDFNIVRQSLDWLRSRSKGPA